MKTPDRFIGPAGEALVRFDLLRRGVVCHSVGHANSSYDLIAEQKERLIRVEIKTAAAVNFINKGRGKFTRRYSFKLGGHNGDPNKYACVDVFAFVALDLQEVLYYPWFDVRGSACAKKIGAQVFLGDDGFSRCFLE